MGIGLGNIFEGGPIKLRSTAASTKRPVERVSHTQKLSLFINRSCSLGRKVQDLRIQGSN